jgi:hypothetical protein
MYIMPRPSQTLHILADSISMHYGPYLKAYLTDHVEYSRKEKHNGIFESPEGSNGQDSVCVLRYLENCVKHSCSWDYLLINCGLHDIRVRPDVGHQVCEGDYKRNLDQAFRMARTISRNLYWINTTPVCDAHHNQLKNDYKRYNADVLRYNSIAEVVTKLHNIAIIDLHSFTSAAGGVELLLDHIHYTSATRMLQAAFMTGTVKEILRRDAT